MARRSFVIRDEEPLLDIVSYGRGGPRSTARLTPAQIDQIRRTVQKVPEAMVKVLPRDSHDLKSAVKHLGYIGRYGRLMLETDAGDSVQRKDLGATLLREWDVDVDELRRQGALRATQG